MATFPTNPVSKVEQVIVVSVARTDTTAKNLMTLPKGAIVRSIRLQADVASDAATTATVSVGTSTTATEWINGLDVKTSAGTFMPAPASGVLNAVLSADTTIYAKYAETGTASTTGGPWYVEIKFVR